MKKLYATLVMACAVAVASASLPLNQFKAVAVSSSNDATPALALSGHNDAAMIVAVNADSKFKAPARAHESDRWEQLGDATFHEGLILPIFSVSDVPKYMVAAEKSKTTDGLYRIANPYKALADSYPDALSFDATTAEPIYLQVVNSNYCYIESFNTGLTLVSDNSSIYLHSQVYTLLSDNDIETVMNYIPGAFGKFDNGVFKFADPSFLLEGATYYDLIATIGEANYAANGNGKFKIVLPGAVEKDYSITVSNAGCADGNVFKFSFTLGKDVEDFRTYLIGGEYPASDTNINTVAEYGDLWTIDHTNFTWNLNDWDDNIATLFGVTIDADNNALESVRRLIYIVKDNADEWKAVEGKARYTDDIVASIYGSLKDTEHEVDIEVNKNTPGYFRLVNPYAAPYVYASYSTHQCTHNHYIYINATNPDEVYLEESPIGWELRDGAMAVSSHAYYLIKQGKTPDASIFGTLKDNTITFPKKALIARELNYDDANWYYANDNGEFKVVLPDGAGISDITADVDANVPVQYFNLQGQRIVNPAAGQLVIKRQGSTVTKEIVK